MANSLDEILAQLKDQTDGKPPVHLWNPEFCGDMDLRIAADGTWYYMNSPIGRHKLVKLFASVLRYDEDGEYYLVTPVEKLRIKVDVAPFVATQYETIKKNSQDFLLFTTNVGDQVIASQEHPIEVEFDGDDVIPFIHIRANLRALIHRNLYYQLVDIAEIRKEKDLITFGVTSGNEFFAISQPLSESLVD